MGLLDSSLATKGVAAAGRLKILRRHLTAFIRHMTLHKLVNFVAVEYARVRGNPVVSGFPYILKIEPSNICNLRCAYCYDNRRPPALGERPYGRMRFEQFKGLIDEVGPYLFKINLYGFGEPFLFPETYEMISYATKNNIGVGVSSNLNIPDQYLADKIVDSGLEVLIFSCHGVSPESYTRFMAGGEMEVALTNIRKLAEERSRRGSRYPLLDWQYCVTGFNEHEIETARRVAAEAGVDQIRFIRPFFPEDAPEEWFSRMFPKNTYTHASPVKPGCSWLYRAGYVNFDGGLLPCCRDFRLKVNDFGDVFTDGFAPVWNNEAYRTSRALVHDPLGKRGTCSTMCARCPLTQGWEGVSH